MRQVEFLTSAQGDRGAEHTSCVLEHEVYLLCVDFLCGDDEVAFEVMRELRTRHILVPNDLRVASLYDSSMLASITPSVSAVQYDAEQLGKTACRMLLDRLAGKKIVMRQLEGYQVILRDSTKWRERSRSIK